MFLHQQAITRNNTEIPKDQVFPSCRRVPIGTAVSEKRTNDCSRQRKTNFARSKYVSVPLPVPIDRVASFPGELNHMEWDQFLFREFGSCLTFRCQEANPPDSVKRDSHVMKINCSGLWSIKMHREVPGNLLLGRRMDALPFTDFIGDLSLPRQHL
ncbi:hypothetical protein AVEN_96159-1 [Araneus ventricosus]|uniref:Uncharacterized protein n=1 Tax=Araneus ventricosus TaxID=182803 RepID=A0A4Y2H8Q0_ARAVE|nr:hypothetical protein AVEN_96159-1 [Araneus ventricosus]